MSFYFIDNIFYDLAGAMYPDGAQLAVFIGRQLSVIGIIALVTGLLLTGRIVRRYGLRTALLVMPVVVIFCTLVLALGGLLKAPSGILFWAAAVGKTLNVAVGFSLSFAAGTLLYQPIIGSERNRTQTTAEGIVQPLAIGLAGALLLLFHTALHFSATGLSFVFLIIGALWLWVIARLSKEYPRVLSDALVKRSLGDSTTLLFDPAGIAQLHAGLKSRNAGTVLYALNQLEQVEADAWAGTLRAALPDLLGHPAPEVRAFADYNGEFADRHLLHGVVGKWARSKPGTIAIINADTKDSVSWDRFEKTTTALAWATRVRTTSKDARTGLMTSPMSPEGNGQWPGTRNRPARLVTETWRRECMLQLFA